MDTKIVKNEKGEYSLQRYNNVIIPFGKYDLIEELEEGSDWLYKVKINNLLVSGINFGSKYGLVFGTDGDLRVPVIYDNINLKKDDHRYGKYLQMYRGDKVDEYYYNGSNYTIDHSFMNEKDIEIVKKFFKGKDEKYIIDFVNQFLTAEIITIGKKINGDPDKVLLAKIEAYKNTDYLLVSHIKYGDNGDGYSPLFGVFNKEGELIVPCKFISIKNLAYNGLTEFIQKGKNYDETLYHYSNLNEGFYGDCELLLEKKYNLKNKRYLYFKNGKKREVYYLGRKVFDIENVDEIDEVYENLISIKKDGKWGLIDLNKNWIIPYIYDKPLIMKNGYAVVSKNGAQGLIDEYNKVIVDFIYEYMIMEEGLLRCRLKNGLWGVISVENKILIPFEYEELFEISEGLIGALNKENKVGFINTKNEVIIPFKFFGKREGMTFMDYWPVFKYGVANVSNGEYYGYINHKGEEAIPFIYDYGEPFENSVAICTKYSEDNGYGYIEYTYLVYLDGKEILKSEYVHDREPDYDPDYSGYPTSYYDDRMDAYEGDYDALWNTD